MASERVKLFSKIALEVQSWGTGTCSVLTDLPGSAMAERTSFTVPATTTRRTVTSRLPSSTKGYLLQVKYSPTQAAALYRVRVWARELPDGIWQWFEMPLIGTPAEFAPVDLPIPRTPEEWSAFALPIPRTPEEWSASALPIPRTPEEWSAAPLPIPATAEEWRGLPLPVPVTSEEWSAAPLPIPATAEEWRGLPLPVPVTSEEWRGVALPIAPTPVVPSWMDLEVDV